MGLRIRAVHCSDGAWQAMPNEVRVPVSATRVEIWRIIHLVRHLAEVRHSAPQTEEGAIGVTVEPTDPLPVTQPRVRA
jgi:hypothetical protein